MRSLNPKSSIELFALWADDPGDTAWIVWVNPNKPIQALTPKESFEPP